METQNLMQSNGDFDKKLDGILQKLWGSWIFRLSLSSNELFHSNILQYLAELMNKVSTVPLAITKESMGNQPIDEAEVEPKTITWETAMNLLGLFCDNPNDIFTMITEAVKESIWKLTVEREWKNMDLVIMAHAGFKQGNKTTKCSFPLFAIEVKVKAYPTTIQLEEYVSALKSAMPEKCAGQFIPSLFLLTGMGAFVARVIPNVTCLDFRQLAKKLSDHFIPSQPLDASPVPTSYIALCWYLDELFCILGKRLDEHILLEDAEKIGAKLRPYRLHAIWWKLWASKLEQACRNQIKEIDVPDNCGVHYHSAFTRTGNVEVCWKWEGQDKDNKKTSISIGTQIEGSSFRLFLNVVHPGLGTSVDSRQKVEDALLKLCTRIGVFAQNPSIVKYIEGWEKKKGGAPDYTNPWEQEQWNNRLKTCNDSETGNSFFKDKTGTGNQREGFRPRLHGYANADGNGFADFRLQFNGEVTLEKIAALVKEIILEDKYSCVPGDEMKPALMRVVCSFRDTEKKLEWLGNPTLN
jgi:hypothetical protein